MSVAIGLSFSSNAFAQATFSKSANPTSGPAPLTVLYTYTFDNTRGPRAFSVETPSDVPRCAPVVFRGGDTNGNQMADVGEIWTWTCAAVVKATTTNTAFTSALWSICDEDTCTTHRLDFISATATVTIPVLAVSISGRTSVCKDDVVTLTAVPTGGTPPFSFLWSTGATTQSITANTSAAGSFNFVVTVTDSQGGKASANKTLSVAEVCRTEVTPPKDPPEFPLLTTIEWGCGWSFAGRCLSRTITRICVGGQCITNPRSPEPDICPRCDVAVGAVAGGAVGFGLGALLLRARRRREGTPETDSGAPPGPH